MGNYDYCSGRLDGIIHATEEARQLTRDRLVKLFKQQVRMGVKIVFAGDAMVVQLLSHDGKELYRDVVKDIDSKILAGFNCDQYVWASVKNCKDALLKKYFKQPYCKARR